MNKVIDKNLSIGTVVKLKKGDNKFIIIGYYGKSKNSNKRLDYIAYLYPVGFISKNDNYLFNYDEIDQVIFEGYKDQGYFEYIKIKEGEINYEQ